MQVFFDTNVYIAEALLGQAAERIVAATLRGRWRILTSSHVLLEVERVMVEQLECTRRFAVLTCRRARRRATVVEPGSSRHVVPRDPNDSPILRAALAGGADFLVSNDAHLLELTPYEGLRITSMADYFRLLEQEGLEP